MYNFGKRAFAYCSRSGTKLEKTSLSTGVHKKFSYIIHICLLYISISDRPCFWLTDRVFGFKI